MPDPTKKKEIILSPVRIPKELDDYVRKLAYERRGTIAEVVIECIQDHKDRSEIP